MVNFAPKRNATYMSGTHFPTLLGFLPLLSESVQTVVLAYADVITKFSGIDRFPFSIPSHDTYGAALRAARADAPLSSFSKLLHDAVKLTLWKELRNRATITMTSQVNIVVELNALELVSSCPSLRICLDVLTVTWLLVLRAHVPLAPQLPESVSILINILFYLLVIQAQSWLIISSLLSSRGIQVDVQPESVAINFYFDSGRKQHLNE